MANSSRGRRGKAALNGVLDNLYNLTQDLNDVTTGTNGICGRNCKTKHKHDTSQAWEHPWRINDFLRPGRDSIAYLFAVPGRTRWTTVRPTGLFEGLGTDRGTDRDGTDRGTDRGHRPGTDRRPGQPE